MSESEERPLAGEQPKNTGGGGRQPPPEQYRWKPGQSGNPSGRPKGSGSLLATLRRELDLEANEEGVSPGTRDVVKALLRKAREGDPAAQKLVWDRAEGAVEKKLEHSGSVTVTRVVLDNLP